MAWTILRSGLYAELVGALAAPINGTIYAPFGSGRISSAAREDLADAAVAVLSAPANHASNIYELSGTAAWSVADLAKALRVEYAPTALAQERTKLNAAPLLPFQPAMLLSIYSSAAAGFLDAPQSDLPKLVSAPSDSLALAAAEALGKSDTY